MPDLLDKIFDEKTEISGQNPKPSYKSDSGIGENAGIVQQMPILQDGVTSRASTPDLLDRIFDEPDEPGLHLPDDPNEADKMLHEILDIASEAEVPVGDVENHHETFRAISKKQERAWTQLNQNRGFIPNNISNLREGYNNLNPLKNLCD